MKCLLKENDSINKKRSILAAVFAEFTIMAIYAKGIIPVMEQELNVGNMQSWLTIMYSFLEKLYLSINVMDIKTSIVYLLLMIFYYKKIDYKNVDVIVLIVSELFAIFMLLGLSYEKYDSWKYIFENSFQIIFSLIQMIGWTTFFYVLLNELFQYIKNNNTDHVDRQIIYNKKMVAIIILLCWMPIIVAFLPGSFDYDSFCMLKAYNGETTWNMHHPVIATIFQGTLMKLGVLLGSANLGVFICVAIQTMCMIVAFCCVLDFMQQLKTPKVICTLTLVFFALCPVWAAYAQVVIKDTMNLAINVIYIILFMKIILDPSWIDKHKNKVSFFVSMLLVCFYRNTGIYLVVLSVILLLICLYIRTHKIEKLILGILVMCFCFVQIFNQSIVPAMGISPGNPREMLSIPFQQTARYLKEYPNDVTEKEKVAIDKVLYYDTLSEVYDPNLSDPVKATMHSRSVDDIVNYFSAWGSMFLRHPDSYFQATLNNTYGYYSPNCISKSRGTGTKLYISSSMSLAAEEGTENSRIYDVKYINSNKIRNATKFFIDSLWRQIPVLGLCYNTGIYTWVLIICIALLIKYKKYYEILGTLPSILTILFCIASPVNGYVRYMLPVMAVTPLMIAWTLYAIREPETVGYRKKVNKKKTKK